MQNNLLSAIVEKKIIESPTTVSLILKLTDSNKNLGYTAGQFTSIYINVDGKEIKRSYSMSSAPHEDYIQVSIKKVDGGNLSVYIVDKIKEGDSVKLSPPKGKFFTCSQNIPKQYILFGAGSGVAPLFSILKSILYKNKKDKVIFICSHKNKEEILFAKTLEKLIDKYKDRFKLIYTLSQCNDGQIPCTQSNVTTYSGRLNRNLIQNIFNQHLNALMEKEFYMCGPTQYMTEHIKNLLFLGVSKSRLHIESFVSDINKVGEQDNPFKLLLESNYINIKEKSVNTDSDFLIGDKNTDAGFLIGDKNSEQKETKNIIVNIDGQTHTLDYVKNKTILDVIIDSGIDAPYSCLSGACLSCLATITKGCVKQKDLGILDDSNISKKESLVCQAYPLSKSVSVSFD